MAESHQEEDPPKPVYMKQLMILLDLVYYIANAWLNSRCSAYEIVIFASLDIFLLTAKDERDKLQMFHSLPKVFLLHLKNPFILTMFTVTMLVLHYLKHEQAGSSIIFFLAITLSIFAASFGITKITAVSFIVGISAAYMYIWENVEPPARRLDDESEYRDSEQQDDQMQKDHAIAQDLVSKLKRLKVAMIMDKEKSRKHYFIHKGKLSLKSARRCRSVG